MCSAPTARGWSISFPLSLERLGLYNLLVSQALLVIESGQRLDRGELQPGLRAKGRRVLVWRSGGGAGRTWVVQGDAEAPGASEEMHQPAGEPKVWCLHLWGGLIPD